MLKTCVLLLTLIGGLAAQTGRPIVLHAARLFEIETGRVIAPGEVLVDLVRDIRPLSQGNARH